MKMLVSLLAVLLFTLIGFSASFKVKWKLTNSPTTEFDISNKLKLNVAQPTESDNKKPLFKTPVIIQEFFTPPYADGFIIGATLLGQAFLLNFAFISTFIYTLITNKEIGQVYIGFSTESMKSALAFTLPLVVAWLAFENLPFKTVEAIITDARFYALRLLGRNTSVSQALLICLLLAATAGFSEEIFFRGVVQSSIQNVSNFPIALVLSSAIFGFAHFPLWGSNAFAEAILGGTLGFAYWYSGYNLAVPIAIHTMHDFVVTFWTWNSARNDPRRNLITTLDSDVERSYELDAMTEVVFKTLDYNKDGFIDLNELDIGLQLFGYGIVPWSSERTTAAIFQDADTNNDGKIDLDEFKKLLKQDLKQI